MLCFFPFLFNDILLFVKVRLYLHYYYLNTTDPATF